MMKYYPIQSLCYSSLSLAMPPAQNLESNLKRISLNDLKTYFRKQINLILTEFRTCSCPQLYFETGHRLLNVKDINEIYLLLRVSEKLSVRNTFQRSLQLQLVDLLIPMNLTFEWLPDDQIQILGLQPLNEIREFFQLTIIVNFKLAIV